VDVSNLANAWPSFTSAPAFKLDQSLVTSPTTSVPGVFTITLTRTNSGATGTVTLSCIGTGDATGDAPVSCSRNPTQLTLSGTPTSSTFDRDRYSCRNLFGPSDWAKRGRFSFGECAGYSELDAIRARVIYGPMLPDKDCQHRHSYAFMIGAGVLYV